MSIYDFMTFPSWGDAKENIELRSRRDVAYEEVKKLQSQLADARVASSGLTEELARTDAKLSEPVLTMRDLHDEFALESSKPQGYKDVADELRMEVIQFIGSGVGLRMGRNDADFKAAAQKVSNFHIGAEADFNKALVAFPTTPFPFLGKVVATAG
nr:hypothetical protein [Tanacetum cinerariifolium]